MFSNWCCAYIYGFFKNIFFVYNQKSSSPNTEGDATPVRDISVMQTYVHGDLVCSATTVLDCVTRHETQTEENMIVRLQKKIHDQVTNEHVRLSSTLKTWKVFFATKPKVVGTPFFKKKKKHNRNTTFGWKHAVQSEPGKRCELYENHPTRATGRTWTQNADFRSSRRRTRDASF